MFSSLALLIVCWSSSPTKELISERNFLDRVLEIRKQIIENPTPESIEEYVTFVTEYHSKQITYRTFFLRNLLQGEHLNKLRHEQDKLINSEQERLVEPNILELLHQANQDFPKSFHIKFALSQYFFSGQCCIIKDSVPFDYDKGILTFEACLERGIKSPTSLYTLAVHELGKKNADRTKALNYLREAHETNPFVSEYVIALTNEELYQKSFKRALQLSRVLFEMAATTDERMTSFIFSARALQGVGDYTTAMNFIKTGLSVEPRNGFLWMMGLDILRQSDARERYFDHLGFLLNQVPYNPIFFKTYTDYIAAKGAHQWDLEFAEQYALETPNSEQDLFFQQFNLATFFNLVDKPQRAIVHISNAQKYKQTLDEQSQEFLLLLDKLKERIQKEL